jgi:hypothetical protein
MRIMMEKSHILNFNNFYPTALFLQGWTTRHIHFSLFLRLSDVNYQALTKVSLINSERTNSVVVMEITSIWYNGEI